MPNALSNLESAMHPEALSLELVCADGSSNVVDRDTLRIGVSEICEIRLAQGPLLHSVIHNESGVVWIEADVDTEDLFVNGRNCRRMALRDGDVIAVGGLEMTLRFRTSSTTGQERTELEDIKQMSAEELCNRILEEQSEVDAHESARLQGWQNLMAAIRSVYESEQPQTDLPVIAESDQSSEECERLLNQIHEMSEMMNGRTIELDGCEAELVAATALLHETQDRVSRQIEELFEQFTDLPHPGEMRASA